MSEGKSEGMFQASWEKKDRRARLGKVKEILTSDIPIEQKDKVLAQTILRVTGSC